MTESGQPVGPVVFGKEENEKLKAVPSKKNEGRVAVDYPNGQFIFVVNNEKIRNKDPEEYVNNLIKKGFNEIKTAIKNGIIRIEVYDLGEEGKELTKKVAKKEITIREYNDEKNKLLVLNFKPTEVINNNNLEELEHIKDNILKAQRVEKALEPYKKVFKEAKS